MPDAIVIGSGPNGLVAANLLADAGWSVEVLEAAAEPGGAARSGELIEPGFINDHCSAFYPLGAGSPAISALHLEDHGLEWLRAPLVLAHPTADGTCPVLSTDIDETAASFDDLHPGDGDAWRRLYAPWEELREQLIAALFTPFPPVRAAAGLLRAIPPYELARFARFAVLPVRRLGQELFASAGPRRLIAGLSLHADLLPEATLSGFYGWLLAALGQDIGFPVPRGGAGELTGAMVRRLTERGGIVRCNSRVTEIVVRNGRAAGVVTSDGDSISASRSILADVDAPSLYLKLLPRSEVPASMLKDISRFEWDDATFKIDWNLDAPVPWAAKAARQAGTVHITEGVDALSVTASELARDLIPANPFVLFGQQSMTDPTRAPEGKETAWAYTHVPMSVAGDSGDGGLTGAWNQEETEIFVDRIESQVETLAPGFRKLVRGRKVLTPAQLQKDDSNLHLGAVGGGTSQLHQQLIFRPTSGLGRPETPIPGLYLASASAHPGGGVHGACGSNAARAAISAWRGRLPRYALAWASAKIPRKERRSLVP